MIDLIISLEATSDLTKDLLLENDLKIIDMEFMIGEKIFSTKNDDVVSTKLYEKMRSGLKTSTSQINETKYEEFFEELLKENKPILHIAFSSGLSNTYFSALKVAERLNEKYGKKLVYVVDSLCGCSGQGMLGILAREYSKKANTIEEVVEYVEKIKHQLNHCFSVDVLKYLANGGRIKQSSAIIGTILNIKPVMRMDEAGKLSVVQKVITRKRAILALFDKFKTTYNKDCSICFISHADCFKDAEFLHDLIFKETLIKPVITNLGPVIGCHSGPGTISIYFLANNR